ncbi:MAG TPA: type II toxin-antitoxin system RelE/ParE family toxin [Pyrinomonadaceae bacterium]|nr:type II toxin-antitoxin system RelE/ParE family toxin [Pyrinomonadaceae bacterium]
MKKYSVILHPDAEIDILSSYEWGCRAWGEEQARSWARELREAIMTRLASLPESCPLAPETGELGIQIRQLLVRRYRILFLVKKRTVTILHVKGAYISKIN